MSFSLDLHICVVNLSVNLNKIPKKTSQAISVVFSFSQWWPKYSIFFGLFLYYALIKSPLHTYLQVVNFLSNLYLPFTQKTRNTTFILISFIDFKKQSLCIVQEQFGILVQIKDMSYEISDEFNMILEYIWKLSKKKYGNVAMIEDTNNELL